LREHYGDMKRYAEYVASRTANGLVTQGLGDWYDVGEAGPGFAQNTPVPLVETALFYSMLATLSQIAAMLGEKQDAAYFDELRANAVQAFNDTYFDPQTGQYADGSQTANAMPLVLGLVREEHRRTVLAGLIRDIEARGCHTTAGDVGHRFVLLALWQSGRSDLIYRMAVQTDHPSYGYQVEHGATTLTEAWDGPTVGKSQNHYMLGHIEEWLYLGLGGIAYEYDRRGQALLVTVKPAVVGDLTYADASLDTPAGRVAVRWERREERGIHMQVAVPVNTKALVYVPAAGPDSAREAIEEGAAGKARWVGFAEGYAIFIAGSGNYTFDSVLGAAAPVPKEEAI
jgi:hypothetical protein